MIPARTRFESFAAVHADRPAPEGIDPIDWLQVRLAAWEARQPFHVASALPVGAGCSEEAGELADAESPDEIEDAIGDICIYAGQVATRNRLAMSALFDYADELPPICLDPWRELCAAQGKVAHLALKREQRIRAGALPAEEYRERLALALAGLIGAARGVARGYIASRCYLDTGAKILTRDWRANAVTGCGE